MNAAGTRTGDSLHAARARLWGARAVAVGSARRLTDRVVGRPSWESPWGVNLAGYFHSALGLGEGARAVLAGLDARGVPVVPVHMRAAPGQRGSPGFETVSPTAAPFAVNLIYANGDGLRGFHRETSPGFFARRYSIGLWWWEIVPAPARWAAASGRLDEIWVCSAHVQDAVAAVVDVPVVRVRLPVPFPAGTGESREDLGLPEGFLFHSTFDYSSTLARKNPVGLVEAFRRAFAEDSGARLVIKSINAARDFRSRQRLEAAAGGRRDIRIVDRYLSGERKNAMLAQSDCYVSLHRAEGFGHPLAEAMRLGKPVIATAWSGNREFMTPANSYLVDYAMTRVGPGSWPYPSDGEWAEPDLDHAVRLMREVFENPAAAAERGGRAAETLRRHDPSEAGATMEARLDEIRPRAEAASVREVRPSRSRGPRATLVRRRERALGRALSEAPARARERRDAGPGEARARAGDEDA